MAILGGSLRLLRALRDHQADSEPQRLRSRLDRQSLLHSHRSHFAVPADGLDGRERHFRHSRGSGIHSGL